MPSKFVEKCGRWTTHTKSAHESSSSSSKHKTHHMSWTEINHGFKNNNKINEKQTICIWHIWCISTCFSFFWILFSWRFKDFKSNLINMLCGMRVCASLCKYTLDFLYIVYIIVYCNERNLMHNIIQSKWFAVWWIINNNDNNTPNSGNGSGSMYEWLLRIMNKC